MCEWTESARQELQQFFLRMREQLEQSGADPDEVIDDMQRHVDEEVRKGGLQVVTRENICHITAALQVPGEVQQDAASKAHTDDPPVPEKKPSFITGLGASVIILFGVALPALTLTIELLTRMCSSTLFDPIPTIGHILLIALVPIGNLAVCLRIKNIDTRYIRLYSWLNGLILGISLYYTLIFLPFTPFAFVLIIYLGLGLIPLAPLLALITAIVLRVKLRNVCNYSGQQFKGFWGGFGLALVLLLVLSMSQIVTQTGLRLALSQNPETQATGVKLLRKLGNDTIMLRTCYVSNRLALEPVGLLLDLTWRPVPSDMARSVFYRVYGQPFNAVKPPRITGWGGGTRINVDDFDFEQGGDAVAARVRGLFLEQSRLDSVIDADAGTSYTEWTLVFKNESFQQREARAQIELPPGAVVSRLTLWIDGEEREAAFNGRAKVKNAYKSIVQRRRDPVLVTTCGPDKILVQCFPVPPNGGTMKTRIGITAPVALESYGSGLVCMPGFIERNFSIPEKLKHSVWIESKTDVKPLYNSPLFTAGQVKTNRYAVRGSISDTGFSDGFTVQVSRNPGSKSAWTHTTRGGTPRIIQQVIEESLPQAPKRIAVVIDGSARMTTYTNAIAQVLCNLPAESDVCILLAGDQVNELWRLTKGVSEDWIDGAVFEGGCDNIPALIEAWTVASAEPDSAILWLHATQPVELSGGEELLQKWQRLPEYPLLYDLQFGDGPNKVAELLNGMPAVRRVARMGNSRDDLQRLLDQWNGSDALLKFRRYTKNATNTVNGVEADLHLARLWARDTVHELGSARSSAKKAAAVEMAMDYQLVTPVSGAVVLESMAQFESFGLEPVDPETTPDIIPEPGSCILMIGCIMYFVTRKKCT